ncbi:hypothetical protein QJS10_CPA01g01713 [Acorus calamus]|uniref:GBF-interacting protein 1 N-terminal domain-containing protein n=1 Tax=Acorus calamus TaxID=4465 RepID=A0AAV9FQG6_ACOCL|nr:hypothetical protein QJS10_CPA01g01713 [Acorus calamus]
MISSGGGGPAAVVGGMTGIPATSKKMVQSLKEIVNCPESEIYAMLKECNMDPNETIHRLLSQDSFHQVKSKREKKKEIKETMDSSSRTVSSNASSHSVRGGTERGGRESGVARGKPIHKKDNGPNSLPSSSSQSVNGENSVNQRPMLQSDSPVGDMTQKTGMADGTPFPSQHLSGYHSAWLGVPGQVSMADIVRMGRPQSKATSTPSTMGISHAAYAVVSDTSNNNVKHSFPSTSLPSELHQNLHSSHVPSSSARDMVHEQGTSLTKNVSPNYWPLVEQSSVGNVTYIMESSGTSTAYDDPSSKSECNVNEDNLHQSSQLDDDQVRETNIDGKDLSGDPVESMPSPDEQVSVDASRAETRFNDNSLNVSSCHPQGIEFEQHPGNNWTLQSKPGFLFLPDDDAVSLVAANLQQLNFRSEEPVAPPADNNPAVILPDHLQISSVNCSHLSFGSFGSAISGPFSGSFPSTAMRNNLEASAAANTNPDNNLEAGNVEFYSHELLRSNTNDNVVSRSGAVSGSYEVPSVSQSDVVRLDPEDTAHGDQYAFPSSVPYYGLPSTTQPSAGTYSFAQQNSQMQDLAPLSSVMQGYSNSLPSNFLASNAQLAKEHEFSYESFLATQSMPTKYSTALSSISGATMSMPEIAKPVSQTMPATSIPTGPSLTQHLAVHPYPQQSLPLGAAFPNIYGYPMVPQNYFLPPAFQQTYPSNNAFQQSPAAAHSTGIKYMLPQYKNSVSVSSLPHSAAVGSGYGGFGTSTNLPGSFALNPSTAPSASTTYEELLNSHYSTLQQNENSGMWVQGSGSRTMAAALPSSTYYSYQTQNQQSGFRQSQQPSQYGLQGYPNFYHSQSAVSQEHQQMSDGNLNSSQGPASQQSQQIWQHSY